jgi:hypothetical protein
VIDLDSTNGTHVNDQEIPKSRYYELRNSDGEWSCELVIFGSWWCEVLMEM